MILYGVLRRFLPVPFAVPAAALCYAVMIALIVASLSQIGADLRYANL